MLPGRTRPKVVFFSAAALLALVLLDIAVTRRSGEAFHPALVDVAAAKAPAKALAAIATSADRELPNPAPIDTGGLTYDQVNAVVRRALDLDNSDANIRTVIGHGDHVVIKLNLVRAPLHDLDGKRRNEGFWTGSEGHWGDVSDARVVKSVVGYLIEKVGPVYITLVEGATWPVAGKRGTDPRYANSYDVDGWTARWEEFDNISYKDMCEEFNRSQNRTVVDYVDLNEDAYRFVPVPGGAFQREGVAFRKGKFGYGSLIPGTGKLREGYFMPQTILAADKLVNIPAMKMNVGGGTLVFKNYVGAFSSIPYGDGFGKSQMDRNGFAQGMVDIFSYKPTNYAVVAGFWASEKDWPTATLNLHHNVVIAGGNPVAVEATALRAMGTNPADAPQMQLARAKGFGSWEEKDIEVVGKPVRSVRRNFLKHSAFTGIGFQNFLMNGPWKETDLDRDLLGGEAKAKPADGASTAGKRWWVFKHPFGFPEAYVSLNETVPGEDLTNTVTYAYLLLRSTRRQEGILTFGFDDGAKVFLNGKVIFRDDGPKDYNIRGSATPVVLEKGDNRLLIKIKNRFGPCGFSASIEDSSRTMLFDMEVVVPKEKGMAAGG